MEKFTGYTPKMLQQLGADENKPIIVICGGVQLRITHAFVVGDEEKDEFDNKTGNLVIDLDVS